MSASFDIGYYGVGGHEQLNPEHVKVEQCALDCRLHSKGRVGDS